MNWHTESLAECLRIKNGNDGNGNSFCCYSCYNISFKLNVNARKQNGWLIFYFLTVL